MNKFFVKISICCATIIILLALGGYLMYGYLYDKDLSLSKSVKVFIDPMGGEIISYPEEYSRGMNRLIFTKMQIGEVFGAYNYPEIRKEGYKFLGYVYDVRQENVINATDVINFSDDFVLMARFELVINT